MNDKEKKKLYPKNMPVVVSAYCGYYYGPEVYYGTHSEPDDCDTEFKVNATLFNWLEGEVNIKCPRCGAEFIMDDWQSDSVWLSPELNPGLKSLPPYGNFALDAKLHGWK